MKCKRCNSPLPSKGYVCSHCKTLMSNEQIKIQKELLSNHSSNTRAELISEKYGGKKQVFIGREEKEHKSVSILFLFLFLLLFVVIVLLVYFL